MKRLILSLFAVISMISCTNKAPQLGKAPLDKVIKAMTLEEKARLIVGVEMDKTDSSSQATVGSSAIRVPGAAGATHAIERLGIPSVVLSDGPAGLRIDPLRDGDAATYYCTHFPIGTLLASTWNQELVQNVGAAIGNEVLEYGADVLLAPAMNIQRHPLCGRNFEYYSEDPVVAGKTAGAYIRGVQSNGVGTSVKHFAFNNQELNRMGNDARISERAQREIYLKGFEIAIKEASPWTIMSSYNKINGTYTSQSKELLTGILREEWGYKGMVMTDWYGGVDGAAQVWAGNDMIQPGTKKQYDAIIEATKNGILPMKDIDRDVKRILEMILKTPTFKGYQYRNNPDLKGHALVTRQSALEGMVLLENNGALPLSCDIKNIAVFGNCSFNFIAGGTGSGNVNRAYTVSLLDGLKNAGFTVDETLAEKTAERIATSHEEYLKIKPSLGKWADYLPEPLAVEIVPTDSEVSQMEKNNDAAVITLGRIGGEFIDRRSSEFYLSKEERALLDKVCGAFHKAGKEVVVILNTGGVMETASWKGLPDAVLLAWQAGQEGGNSVADILSGKASPSGKLPMTWPVDLMDAKASENFPIDINSTNVDMSVKNEDQMVRNVDYTEYREGIYVGYRWFDRENIPVSYPFGYGLSYTKFEYSDATATRCGNEISVSIKVTNTGNFAGKEAVQIYISAPRGGLDKPVKELKAYGKTDKLQSGESQVLDFSIPVSDLASYDESTHSWLVEKGTYYVLFGASSKDIRSDFAVEIN